MFRDAAVGASVRNPRPPRKRLTLSNGGDEGVVRPLSLCKSSDNSLRAFQTIYLGVPDDDLQTFRIPRSYFRTNAPTSKSGRPLSSYDICSDTRTIFPTDGCDWLRCFLEGFDSCSVWSIV